MTLKFSQRNLLLQLASPEVWEFVCRCVLLLNGSDLSFWKNTCNHTALGPSVPDFCALASFRAPYYWFPFIWGVREVLSLFFLSHHWTEKRRSNGLNPFLHNSSPKCPRKLSPHTTGNCSAGWKTWRGQDSSNCWVEGHQQARILAIVFGQHTPTCMCPLALWTYFLFKNQGKVWRI